MKKVLLGLVSLSLILTVACTKGDKNTAKIDSNDQIIKINDSDFCMACLLALFYVFFLPPSSW